MCFSQSVCSLNFCFLLWGQLSNDPVMLQAMEGMLTVNNSLLVFGNTILQGGLCFVECADLKSAESE